MMLMPMLMPIIFMPMPYAYFIFAIFDATLRHYIDIYFLPPLTFSLFYADFSADG